MPADMAGEFPEDLLSQCDCDRIGLTAADALENTTAHVMALQQEIEKLRGQIILQNDELLKLREQVPRWIPVTERLPEDCTDVLTLVSGLHRKCTFARAPMLCAWFGDEGWFCNEYPDWDNPGVTHWMPLPKPPKPPKEEKDDV